MPKFDAFLIDFVSHTSTRSNAVLLRDVCSVVAADDVAGDVADDVVASAAAARSLACS